MQCETVHDWVGVNLATGMVLSAVSCMMTVGLPCGPTQPRQMTLQSGYFGLSLTNRTDTPIPNSCAL